MSKRVKLEGKGGGSARRSTSSGSNASSKSGDGGGGGGEDNEVEEQQKKSAIAMVKWAEVLTEVIDRPQQATRNKHCNRDRPPPVRAPLPFRLSSGRYS